MPLKGNLQDFTITQLLNLINLANKTGALSLEGSYGAAWVYFREGKLSYAQMTGEEASLVGILHQSKKLSSSQYRKITEHIGGVSDKELGILLINANYFSQQDILSSLQSHFVTILNRLLGWVEGIFSFDPEKIPPEDKITVRVNLENIILEGSRQLQERAILEDEIPSLDMALRFTERPGVDIRQLKLSPVEWKVISFVNPKNTIRQIAQATHLSELEMRRVIYSFLQAGLVEITKPVGGIVPISTSGQVQSFASGTDKEERKSIISRLIKRIRSL
jgi:hypothetical protein